tara:strand:- start:226 stop:990 length:765 start_codon:yes stop_codon:yes gene_type:complete
MHYSPLIDRKLNIENLLDELEIEGEFITEFDKEVLNKSDKKLQQNILLWKKELNLIKSIMIRNIIETNRNSSIAFKLYWQYIKFFQNIITPKSFMPRELSLSEKSLTLKHHLALEKIYESKEPGLIIEDDIILKPESKQLIEDSYFLCKKNFDFIDLGGGCDLPIFKEDKKINENDRFINLKIPRSRTTAAYMISSDCAKVLSNGLLPLTMPIDWKYQFLFVKNNLKVAWSYPSAFVHGSESIFKTSIDKFSNV